MAVLRVTTSKARRDFAALLKRVKAGERIVLQRHKKGVAAIVSIHDLAVLEAIEDRSDAEAARLALAEAEEHGTIPWEKIKADMGL